MLYQLGPLCIDTIPFSIDEADRTASAGLAQKPVMGSRPNIEFMGPDQDTVTLSGHLVPTKLGGLTELETARSLMESGTQLPLMRGDGVMLGWFAIKTLSEKHQGLLRSGIGFRIRHSLELVRVGSEPDRSAGAGLVGMILSLFENL